MAIGVLAEAADDARVTLDLKPATMLAADQQTLARYKSNPVNLRCDFVSFDSKPLRALIASLDASEIAISDSFVSVWFPNGAVFEYGGYAWEGVARHGRGGPFVWEGKVEGGARQFASLIIYGSKAATAYFATAEGMYRLSRSSQQGRYFLCLRDPEFRRNNS